MDENTLQDSSGDIITAKDYSSIKTVEPDSGLVEIQVGDYVIDVRITRDGKFVGIETIRHQNINSLSNNKWLSTSDIVNDYPNE